MTVPTRQRSKAVRPRSVRQPVRVMASGLSTLPDGPPRRVAVVVRDSARAGARLFNSDFALSVRRRPRSGCRRVAAGRREQFASRRPRRYLRIRRRSSPEACRLPLVWRLSKSSDSLRDGPISPPAPAAGESARRAHVPISKAAEDRERRATKRCRVECVRKSGLPAARRSALHLVSGMARIRATPPTPLERPSHGKSLAGVSRARRQRVMNNPTILAARSQEGGRNDRPEQNVVCRSACRGRAKRPAPR